MIPNTSQYTLQETYLYGSSRLGVKNQQLNLSTRVASVQNGSLTPIGNAILNTDSVFSGTASAYNLPKAPSSRVFYRTWGLKQYELSNHLGNVQVTISDKKIGVLSSNQVDFVAYEPEVKSATDYYAYGMEMPGKTYQSTTYRYGMNTQEKDNEIYGPGNTLGALYWEYDARIARRWNVDPVVVPSLSNYHAFEGNPIMMVDPLGNSAGIFKKDPNTGKETKVSDFGDKQGFDVVITGSSNEDGSINSEGVKTETYKVVNGIREELETSRIENDNTFLSDASDMLSVSGYTELVSTIGFKGFDSFFSDDVFLYKTSNFLKNAGKYLGFLNTYVGTPVGIANDYEQFKKGRIGNDRLTYKVTGQLGSVIAGSMVGGALGVLTGAVISSSFMAGELIYDSHKKYSKEIDKFLLQTEQALRNGWVPGRN